MSVRRTCREMMADAKDDVQLVLHRYRCIECDGDGAQFPVGDAPHHTSWPCSACDGSGFNLMDASISPAASNPVAPDPRDPDDSRSGIFIDHNCWKCDSGKKPCPHGHSLNCEYPHARND